MYRGAAGSKQSSIYGGYELCEGDNDRLRKWGGRTHPDAVAGKCVAHLQGDLSAVACYRKRVDGVFGHATMMAVKRFQWCVHHARHGVLIRTNSLVLLRNDAQVNVNGRVDMVTAGHLKTWIGNRHEVTGTLRVLSIGQLSRFKKGGLDRIAHPSVGADDMVVHEGFVKAL